MQETVPDIQAAGTQSMKHQKAASFPAMVIVSDLKQVHWAESAPGETDFEQGYTSCFLLI
jgi:hypothetical protein